ncbi:hypothetical protein AAFF_G00257340, partial [Aldrovandia affinis]
MARRRVLFSVKLGELAACSGRWVWSPGCFWCRSSTDTCSSSSFRSAEIRRLCHNFEAVALLIIGMLCLVIILRKDDPVPNIQTGNVPIHARKPFSERSSPQSPVSEVTGWHTRSPCVRNASAADVEGFSALPGHIQDFLFYRHCRHFPLLLDVPRKCGGTAQGSADVFLLLVIKTSPWNYDRR